MGFQLKLWLRAKAVNCELWVLFLVISNQLWLVLRGGVVNDKIRWLSVFRAWRQYLSCCTSLWTKALLKDILPCSDVHFQLKLTEVSVIYTYVCISYWLWWSMLFSKPVYIFEPWLDQFWLVGKVWLLLFAWSAIEQVRFLCFFWAVGIWYHTIK